MLNTAIMLASSTAKRNSWVSTIIMLVIFFGLMYLLMIRPQKKKEKEQQEMRNALQKGDEVVTIGGICGTVSAVKKDQRIVIEVGSNRTKMEIMPWGISKTISKSKKSTPASAVSSQPKNEEDERTGNKGLKMLKKKEPEKEAEPAPKKAQKPAAKKEAADDASAEAKTETDQKDQTEQKNEDK